MRILRLRLVALLLVSGYLVSSQLVPHPQASWSAVGQAKSALVDSEDRNDVSGRRYVLDSSQSRFVARAFSGGLLWFKGHDHLIAVREFRGEAQITPESITSSSLEIIANAASLVETRDVFTEPQKKIINQELREIVLLPEQYPEIVFKSTHVTGQAIGNNVYELKIVGALTLHGVTRAITIPTKVTLTGNDIRAQGEFSINRSDFKVTATSAVHGLVRVRDKIKFEFDIIGHQH